MAVEAPPAEALDPVAAGARPMGGAVALMSLPAEVLSHLLGQLPTTDLLACACVASALRRAATQILNETKALRLRGTATSSTQLERLLCKRMRGTTQELDVCACPKISKAHVVMSVRNSQMALLHARDVGKGSWTVRALEQLLCAAPLTLRRGAIEIDCRIAINIDVPAACAVLALPMLRVRRLVIISDYSAGRVGAAAGAAAAELELPGPAVPGAAVPGAAALGPRSRNAPPGAQARRARRVALLPQRCRAASGPRTAARAASAWPGWLSQPCDEVAGLDTLVEESARTGRTLYCNRCNAHRGLTKRRRM
jgi:hypothetical protein